MSGECDICGEWGCVESNHKEIKEMKLKELAESIFNDYKGTYLAEWDGSSLDLEEFTNALIAYNNEIEQLIDEVIEQVNPQTRKGTAYEHIAKAQIAALTELKQKITNGNKDR